VTEPSVWIALALTGISLLAATATLALRDLSRIKLQELLEARGQPQWVDKLFHLREEMILATAAVRMTANVGIILATLAWLHAGPGQSYVAHYVEALAVSSVLILVFGVAIPNAWAKHAAEPFLVRMLPVLRFWRWLLHPLSAFLALFDGLVRRLAGVTNDSPHAADAEGRQLVEREILEAVSEGEMHGTMDEDEKEMIESVIELRDTSAGQIMTPRTEMITIQADATLDHVKALIASQGHSRIPVCDGSLDNVIGVLYAKDLLQLTSPDQFDARKLMRPVKFVPETKAQRDLLREFQANKVHMAIVLDEYGGTAGLVTIEDILEELVGEIADEYEPPEPEPVLRLAPNALEVDGRVRINQINDELGSDLPEDQDYDTVGGFVFSTLGRIPRSGEGFTHNDIRIKILDASPRRINRLRIERLSDASPS
jgi:putative hemolysin